MYASSGPYGRCARAVRVAGSAARWLRAYVLRLGRDDLSNFSATGGGEQRARGISPFRRARYRHNAFRPSRRVRQKTAPRRRDDHNDARVTEEFRSPETTVARVKKPGRPRTVYRLPPATSVIIANVGDKKSNKAFICNTSTKNQDQKQTLDTYVRKYAARETLFLLSVLSVLEIRCIFLTSAEVTEKFGNSDKKPPAIH